ncbi:hypothetical protein C8R44DRAFT_864410 [Mycena epipterygia]|nr:hypothetical protein C8R44DRAFT_864410 [Mycena epipterygia]
MEDERRSSSLTCPHGAPDDTLLVSTNAYATAPLAASPTRSLPPSSASPATSSSTTPSSSLAIPSAPSATRNRYAVLEPECHTIAVDHVDWVVPPPIAPARKDKGKWGRWLLEDYNEQFYWVGRERLKT